MLYYISAGITLAAVGVAMVVGIDSNLMRLAVFAVVALGFAKPVRAKTMDRIGDSRWHEIANVAGLVVALAALLMDRGRMAGVLLSLCGAAYLLSGLRLPRARPG